MYKIDMRKTTKLMNKIKKLNKWRAIPCSWTRRLNIVKMSVMSVLPSWLHPSVYMLSMAAFPTRAELNDDRDSITYKA